MSSLPSPEARLRWLVLVAALVWHAFEILGPSRDGVPGSLPGRDFASYYYAAQVASAGGDPYDVEALSSAAAADGLRSTVHPYFYPPPFLLLVGWALPLPLMAAFWVWFALNELALIGTFAVLTRWWRPFGPIVAPMFAVLLAVTYAVQYSAELGQVNFPVLLLILAGASLEPRRPGLAGAVLGLACLMKMSPALIVIWWALRGRWVAVAAAVVTGAALSVAALPLVGVWTQLHFYRDVLPGFAAGDYNGLTIRLDMFGNHSLPNVWNLYFPTATGTELTPPARFLSTVSALVVVAGLAAAFRRETTDPVQRAAQLCAWLVAMLLLPVYTYEHHLIFALPAMTLAIVAVHRGWLPSGWAWAAGLAVALLAFPLPPLKQLAQRVIGEERALLFLWTEEAKFAALLVLGAAMVWLGGTAWDDRSRPPAPPL